ncbi:calmodulin-binding protein 60 A-like isoform X2 [Impatiens glandulifera]|nr:calmodulin-binding protein 60 A-like isoform X2 [Impatiens glandulifera]
MNPSHCRTLLLRFMNKLPKQVWTGSKVEGEDGNCIKVALVDEVTGEIVKSGPGASARTRIMMIDGNYTGENDLNEKINEANKRTELRLKGDAFLSLKEGIGCIDNLHFVHERTWFNKGTFVFVATLVDNIDAIKVKAAVMEPFTIKDHRNSLYKKKEIPSLDDFIWRLKKISRGSPVYKFLEKSNITTLLTFLRELNLNPERLQQIVGAHMTDKAFKATVSHAEKCEFDREKFYKCNDVVFNIVGEIVGGYFKGDFLRFDEFNDHNKVIARNTVLYAFEHGNYFRHTINSNTVSNQMISSVNPQIGDIPGPSSVTDFDLESIFFHIDTISRIAQERWKNLYRLFRRRNVVVSEFGNDNNNAQKRQRIC